MHYEPYSFIPATYFVTKTVLISGSHPVLRLALNFFYTSISVSLYFRCYIIQFLTHASTIFLNFRVGSKRGWCIAASEAVKGPSLIFIFEKVWHMLVFQGQYQKFESLCQYKTCWLNIPSTNLFVCQTYWHPKLNVSMPRKKGAKFVPMDYCRIIYEMSCIGVRNNNIALHCSMSFSTVNSIINRIKKNCNWVDVEKMARRRKLSRRGMRRL